MPKFRSKADVRGFQMRSPFNAVRAGAIKNIPVQSEDTANPIDENIDENVDKYADAMRASTGLGGSEPTKFADMPKSWRERGRRKFGRWGGGWGPFAGTNIMGAPSSFYTGPTTPGEMYALAASSANQMQYGYGG